MLNYYQHLNLNPELNESSLLPRAKHTHKPPLNLAISLSQSKTIYFHTNTLFLPLNLVICLILRLRLALGLSLALLLTLSVSLSQGMSRSTCMFSLWVFLFVNLLFLCIVWFWVLIQVGFDPEINLILGFDQFIYLINLYFSVITRMLVWLCLSFGFFIRMLVFCDY